MLSPSSQSVVRITLNVLLLAGRISAQHLDQTPLQTKHDADAHPPRIAIIGAGAAGSSSAYHLSKFYNDTNDAKLEIDVFELNSYVGGRTTTINALNDPRYPTELGGSIFVTVNHVLYNLTRDFGLSTREDLYESTGAVYDLGIWDGSSFLFTIANDDSENGGWKGRWKGYWDVAKLLWKYGLSPIWTQRAKNNVVSKFLRMYDEYFPIASLTNFVSEVGLAEYTGITGQAALVKNSVSERFAREIVQSSTRVNYAQNLNSIHGLETMVCMAIEGAMSIDGGNWQIFNEAVKRSGAKLHLNTTVTTILKTPQSTYQIHTSNTSATTHHENTREYDTVVLASPYQFSNITITPPLHASVVPEKIDYVTLHVTLFTSPYRPSPSYFDLTSQDLVPDSILTTLPDPLSSTNSDSNTTTPRGRAAVGPTRFWSLSTLRVINPQHDPFAASISDEDLVHASKLPHTIDASDPAAQKQYLYKIFSPEPVTATFLSELFDLNYTQPSPSSSSSSSSSHPNTNEDDDDPISNLPTTQIPWHHIKTWHSYPYLPPRTSFSALKLDSARPCTANHDQAAAAATEEDLKRFNAETKITRPHWTDAYGVYYTSGIEAFISTMETSALMGRNVARIIVDGLEKVKEGEIQCDS